ncbi:methyltransferase domain-containing protein [Acidovorax sp.]|uniref:methyltransferase domain-containing protein n=1 Tax=Acidovorax sp. TaxID=1872122 RepID=UPI002ACE835F|nr:methyltransferase domain-containing protein [Acidovorax sp.]MDZ7866215.1 methyltransferase domain-containing protein [Acidovorax sp.]
MEHKHLHEANRLSWNAATRAHNRHKGDQAVFFRNGGSPLFAEETALLGDLHGQAVLHLQCNAGQDSLGIARLGARVTGVDISDEAIAFARALSDASGIAAEFVRSDVYDYFDGLAASAGPGGLFDTVFSSYGTICWLSDLARWARGIRAALRPGGRFVFVEFHPAALVFDPQWQARYDYFNEAPVHEAGVGDYVGETQTAREGQEAATPEVFANPHPSHEFAWGVGRVVTALLAAGLQVEALEEYPYMNGWRAFGDMQDLGGRRWGMPAGMARMPLMYSLVARRPAAA